MNQVHLNEDISIVIDEVDRLNNIIDRFLDFARPKELNLELCNINEVLNLVVKLISKEMLPKNIEILMELYPMYLLSTLILNK